MSQAWNGINANFAQQPVYDSFTVWKSQNRIKMIESNITSDAWKKLNKNIKKCVFPDSLKASVEPTTKILIKNNSVCS